MGIVTGVSSLLMVEVTVADVVADMVPLRLELVTSLISQVTPV